MNIPINLFYWLMCTVPILLLIVFMLGLQWSAIKAAPITLVVTIILGMVVFKASSVVIGVELLRALWSAVSIVLVILAAILLYEVSHEADAFKTLNHLFQTVAPNELIRILLIGVVFASFLQGVTGFGVPVLIAAPLLIRIGVQPLWAVIIPLVGHSWAGTFGTLALAWDALLEQITADSLAFVNSSALFGTIFLFVLTLSANLFISYSYGKGEALKKGLPAILAVTVLQGGGQILVSQLNPELASFLPSAITLIGLILLSKTPLYNEEWAVKDSKIMESKTRIAKKETTDEPLEMSIPQALIPYILMMVITLVVLLVSPVKNLLDQVAYGPDFIETVTGFGVVNEAVKNASPLRPFTHASMFLFLSAMLTYFYYKKENFFKTEQPMQAILNRTFKRAVSPSIAVVSLLAISRVMAGTGQTIVLAEGMTNVLGPYYSLVAPFIGLLGSFITGSNMSSNIIFGSFQYLTADFIGLNVPVIVGSQTAGGAVGMALAPGNIVLGTSATGALGLEGKVLVKIIPFALTVTAIIGILTFLI